MNILQEIQQKLKAPKNQYNKFGQFAYRSCEDILEAIKPLLGDATVTLSDDIVLIGDRYYVKSTANFHYNGESVIVSAFAREPQIQKGMNESQITGSASSYARKYALNGLFCIDDSKCPDENGDNGLSIPEPDEGQWAAINAVLDALPHREGMPVDQKKVMSIFIEHLGRYPTKIETAQATADWLVKLDRPEIYKKDNRSKFEKDNDLPGDEDSQPEELRYYCNGCSQEFNELKNDKCPKCQRKAAQVVDRRPE